jgi:glycosyltransferase involved in cell wall biosynthesis
MKFSIITPSFRNSEWLKLCIPSVADQGVEHEHIVQDAVSDDGTLDWLPSDPRVQAFAEKDRGMYDAVTRGFKRASGDVLAYLNCDEQYLPGALAAVGEYFERHPEIDVVISDIVVTDGSGAYICHRYALVPYWTHLWIRFNVSTSALFMRRRAIEKYDLYFQPEWKHLGDFFWIEEAVRRGLRFGVLRRFTSLFTETGINISWDPSTIPEEQERRRRTPPWILRLEWLFTQLHRARIALSGAMQQRPFSYGIYTRESPDKRVSFSVPHPTTLWPERRKKWREV